MSLSSESAKSVLGSLSNDSGNGSDLYQSLSDSNEISPITRYINSMGGYYNLLTSTEEEKTNKVFEPPYNNSWFDTENNISLETYINTLFNIAKTNLQCNVNKDTTKAILELIEPYMDKTLSRQIERIV
jgi:hypothetical protein